ncbi:hypothetical protein RCOM_1268850 [Ricinus communis]|uniref:IP5PC-F beta-propeller domain-containing protein n=1 Tax=Ricinus communis TaxID=3988 RepID=B9SSY4_RICCO|nr:hypothetical protein RCOM_1268850 [Ricinus communis]
MEDDRIEEEDREALAGLTTVPPPNRKVSYSHQLRSSSGGGGQKRHNQIRKHSLDNISPPATTASEQHLQPRLDMSLSVEGPPDREDVPHIQPLPEFVASGGTGIFKAPIRAAVHPGRPPCLELRPHPLRETQVGKFLRNIACTETQLWAGQECGIRFWKFDDAYGAGYGLGGRVRRGDEDAAPFYESVNTSPTMCLMVDSGNRLVWSGHKDGKIKSWKMDHSLDDFNSPFKEGLSWQAHKGPVLSIVMSSYGDLWSGGEGGTIKIWPWETIEKSLSLSPEEKHMAALLVERSHIDLRSQVTVNGACSISSSDIKCLLSDKVRAKVWCAQSFFFSLWYVFTLCITCSIVH